MRIIASGPKIDQTLTYRDVSFHKVEAGKLPDDLFLPTDQTPPLASLKLNRTVFLEQPDTVNGAPDIREKTERFQGKVTSPLASGIAGGAIGGLVGFIVGAFPAILTGNGAWMVGGALAGAAGAGFLGAASASGREMQLSVEEKPIQQKTMTGIDTNVSAGTLKGRQGFYHRFAPRLESTTIGTYDVPSLEIVKKEPK